MRERRKKIEERTELNGERHTKLIRRKGVKKTVNDKVTI